MQDSKKNSANNCKTLGSEKFKVRDPFYDDYGYQTDRSMLRLTIYDAKNGDPLWTGLRSTQYVDKELKLDQEQISKYVQSFLSELVG